MYGITKCLFNPEYLLIIITPLNITRDYTLRTQCLARLSIEELVPLRMIGTQAEIFEFLIFAADGVTRVFTQDGAACVQFVVAGVAKVHFVIDAVPCGLRLLRQGLMLVRVSTHEVAHLVDRRHDYLARDLINQSTALLIEDAILVADVVIFLQWIIRILCYVDRVVNRALESRLEI